MNDIISADSTEYIGKFTYEKGKFRTYQFGSGHIEASSTSYTYRYYMKDHLGNNRVVSTLSGSIMQTNHYYPYQLQCTWHSASNSCG